MLIKIAGMSAMKSQNIESLLSDVNDPSVGVLFGSEKFGKGANLGSQAGEDKVKSLRDRVRKGLYQVDPCKVVEGISKEAIRNRILTND